MTGRKQGLPAPFRQELAEVDQLLATAGRKLASLKGQAEFDNFPAEAVRRLQAKANTVSLIRQDLRGIPGLVEEAEERKP